MPDEEKFKVSENFKKKLARKVKRCQQLLQKDGIAVTDDPSLIISCANSGLLNGLQSEELLEELSKYGKVCDISMLPNKSYCFFKMSSIEEAKNVMENMNGISCKGQNGAPLILTYIEHFSENIAEKSWTQELPKGLILIEDFVNEHLEQQLIDSVKWNAEDSSHLKHRQVKHFGYEFLYTNGLNTVDPKKPLKEKIPIECSELWKILKEKTEEFQHFEPDQLTVNKYGPGQGIPPHCDTHSPFEDPIVSLSLGSDIVMEFKQNEKTVNVLLRRRSLLVMSGEARFGWQHGITPRTTDIVPINKILTVRKRSVRYSFTFRMLKVPPFCNCNFKSLCDFSSKESSKDFNEEYEQKVDDTVARKLENENVHQIYDKIGNHFSETRHSPWPNVQEFIQSLDRNSILLDVGCGNGKYLNINESIFKMGCDRSETLLNVCHERNFNVFQCDCLNLPVRDDSIDGCISIAVIHHLATKQRRLQAIREMARILRKSGKALVYVWAKKQNKDNKKSAYLKQNLTNPSKENQDAQNQEILVKTENISISLPVHTNRTEFQHQNLFVPWKLKNMSKDSENQSEVFLRYYHVFEENELEEMCKEISEIRVVKSYYDQGNWCVIFEKVL